MIPLSIEKELAILGGSRRDAVEQAPQALGRAAFVGLANLASSLAAGIAAAHVVGVVFRGPLAPAAATLAGLLATLLVLMFHRVLFFRPSQDGGWRERLLQAAPRVALAVAVALGISTSLTLRLCQEAILKELESERQERLRGGDGAALPAASLAELRQRLQNLESLVGSLRDARPEEPDSEEYRAAKADFERAQVELAQLRASVEPALESERKVLTRLLATPGTDPRLIEALRGQMFERQHVLDQASERVKEAQQRLDAAGAPMREVRLRLAGQIQAELDRLLQALVELTKQASARKPASDASAVNAEPTEPSLVDRWRALLRIASDDEHPDHAAVRQVAFRLDLLLILLELTPLLIGLLLPANALDRANEALDLLEGERIVLGVNAQVEQWRSSARAYPPGS
jgi:hypothetical protein